MANIFGSSSAGKGHRGIPSPSGLSPNGSEFPQRKRSAVWNLKTHGYVVIDVTKGVVLNRP